MWKPSAMLLRGLSHTPLLDSKKKSLCQIRFVLKVTEGMHEIKDSPSKSVFSKNAGPANRAGLLRRTMDKTHTLRFNAVRQDYKKRRAQSCTLQPRDTFSTEVAATGV